jgi:penicillin amidase
VPDPATEAAAPWPDVAAHALQANDCAGSCDTLLTASLAEATAALTRSFGPTPAAWRWGAAHQAVFAHPLLRAFPALGALVEARIASPGSDTTVDRGGMPFGSFESVHGASFRGVYDLADLDRSLFVVAPGQSGHVASPLARNFVHRWRDGAAVMLGPYAAPTVTITLTGAATGAASPPSPGDGS